MSDRNPIPEGRYEAETDDDNGENVRARFYPDFPAEVVVTEDDEIHLFTDGDHRTISMSSAEDVYDVLAHLNTIQNNGPDETYENTVFDVAAFAGIFRFLAQVADNPYMNPPDRVASDYESAEDDQ